MWNEETGAMQKKGSLLTSSFGLLALLLLSVYAIAAQETSIVAQANQYFPAHVSSVSIDDSEPPPMPLSPKAIIAAFLKSEVATREALNQHTFKRAVVLQTIGPNGQVTGEYIRNSQFLFDDRGNRIERVLYHPASTIREMRITREDIQDLAGAQLLGVDIAETGKYRLSYLGMEILDARTAFIINVAPATTPDAQQMKERYFVGRVWIDANTFNVIRVKGVVEPQGKQRFPIFETSRSLVADALVFPSLTTADQTLRFPARDVHYRINVKYYDYQRFASKVTITEMDVPAAE
ncbi:MAG: hypothetical protein ABI698_11575 [bacterium]